jgi:hypothetical protein
MDASSKLFSESGWIFQSFSRGMPVPEKSGNENERDQQDCERRSEAASDGSDSSLPADEMVDVDVEPEPEEDHGQDTRAETDKDALQEANEHDFSEIDLVPGMDWMIRTNPLYLF